MIKHDASIVNVSLWISFKLALIFFSISLYLKELDTYHLHYSTNLWCFFQYCLRSSKADGLVIYNTVNKIPLWISKLMWYTVVFHFRMFAWLLMRWLSHSSECWLQVPFLSSYAVTLATVYSLHVHAFESRSWHHIGQIQNDMSDISFNDAFNYTCSDVYHCV